MCWDNDAQLSEHILWPGWHSEQQSWHRPTNPDRNTYSQTQWASVFTHKSQPLRSLFVHPSLSGFLLQVQPRWFSSSSWNQLSHKCTCAWAAGQIKHLLSWLLELKLTQMIWPRWLDPYSHVLLDYILLSNRVKRYLKELSLMEGVSRI